MAEKNQRVRVAGMIVAALLFVGASPAIAQVSAEDSWIAETPPGAETAAGYLVFMNAGDAAVKIVGVESPRCERVEMHTTDMEGGVARMRKQDSLTVPAGGKLALEPGGTHLMLIRPEPLSQGGTIPISFKLSTGDMLTVVAMVKKQGGGRADEPGTHEHHHEH